MRNPFTHTHSCVCPCMWQWLCSMITLPLCDNMSFIFSLWSVGGGYDMGFVITLLLFLYYPGNWQDNCAALVLGGGYDMGFVITLLLFFLLSRGLAGQLCGTGPWWGL